MAARCTAIALELVVDQSGSLDVSSAYSWDAGAGFHHFAPPPPPHDFIRSSKKFVKYLKVHI